MSRHENDDYFKVLLRRVEALAIENNQVRGDLRKAEHEAYTMRQRVNNLCDVGEHLQQARVEIERMKKKHPKLVKLPAFMRPPSDDDIPF